MSDIHKLIASLPADRRALFELLAREQGIELPVPPIVRLERKGDPLPPSFAQERLWFLNQFDPGSPAYNIPVAVRLTGHLDLHALQHALDEIARRHETLRTTFATIDGLPMQIIAPNTSIPLSALDLTHLPPNQRDAQATTLATQEARQPFDLSRGPLFRTTLFRLADDDHIVLLTMHHIISDGWSMGILVHELATLYQAFTSGQPSPLPDLPIQYADFAHWQRNWLQGDALESQLTYWKTQLAGDLPILELPTDRPRPAVQTSRGATLHVQLPQSLTKALIALSREEEATLFMTLLAAYQVLLARYTGCDDICVGTPIANRNRSEIEGLIGFFVNTLVLRTDLSGDPTFRDVLRRVREVTLGAYAHQELPFEMLVERLRPHRDTSRTPLFQTMFMLQNAPKEPQQLPGLTLTPLRIDTRVAVFDLTVAIEERADGLSGALEYNCDLFDAATIARLWTCYETLLAAIASDPGQPVSRLPLIAPQERRQLLLAWNDTAAHYPADRCIHQLFEAQVERAPDSVAVVLEGEQLSYRELNRRANRLARHLQKRGVGPESLVAVCLQRSPDMIAALLGILKAGGAYLPLDPSYPAQRLAFMLQDSSAPLLVTEERLRGALPVADLQVVSLDGDGSVIAQESDHNPPSTVAAANLAYVIYTSGSTGKPKGVEVPHRAMVNHNLAVAREFGLTPADRVLQFATISFDAAAEEIFPTLLSGATLMLRPAGTLAATDLLRLIERHGLTVLDLPTTYWHDWVQELARLQATLPPSLRLVVVGGERAAPERFAAWKQIGGQRVGWLNTYGPTEATIAATLYDPALGHADPASTLPIGRPIANTQVYVLDRFLQPLPPGVAGELHIGGLGVARGYLGQPALTAERFISLPPTLLPEAAPFSLPPETQGDLSHLAPRATDHGSPVMHHLPRLYRTGDRVRFLPDGNLEFLGRVDEQVKVRGFRVEPAEIEAMLARHPSVQQCAVVAQDDGHGGKRLVAYVVRQGGAMAGVRDLRHFLAENLPDYMIPGAFVFLEVLPLTPSGKLDRQSLPAPGPADAPTEATSGSPRTPQEEIVAAIWAQVLGAAGVGIHDNFFELGGHSLLATQVVSRLREAFHVDLPLSDLFEAPTVAALAERIQEAQAGKAPRETQPLRPIARDGDLPLSFAQQRLWFLTQIEPDSPAYNVPEAVRLTGPLDAGLLERCLAEVVRRHEILRTTIATVDGRPRQVIAPDLPMNLPLLDLADLPESEREAEALRLAREQAQQPFDLSRGPLFRMRLLRLGDEEHILLLTMHHIIADAWSTGILTQELAALYLALADGQPSPLPDLPIQYADFAHWQRQWLQGEVLEEQLAYWKQQLAGSPPVLELPTDRPRPPVQSSRGAHQVFALPVQLTQALRALCRHEGVTLFMALLGAFQSLLCRYTGQEDICVGTPVANRNRAEIEPLIGFFVNTLVLRTDLSGDPTFRDLLRRVREVTLGAYAHQDLPFEILVDALQPQRDPSHNPLFQVMFMLQNVPMRPVQLPGLTLKPLMIEMGTANFDLMLAVEEVEERLVTAFEYNTDLFDATTIERLAGHFHTLLEGAVADPDRQLSQLPLLTAAEQRTMATWNDTATEAPQGLCVHQLFEAQARRSPGATAVVSGVQSLNYDELNRRANRLAHRLRRLGAGPETFVGICVERSLDMVVGLLGILKAGAAYLPLDPAYPRERLAFMLGDARVPMLVAQEPLLARLPSEGVQIICLDAERESLAAEPDEDPVSGVTADNAAYLIYTSGSTGQPKGVVVTHRSVVNHNVAVARQFQLKSSDRVLQFATISFDAAVEELFPTWLSGATVVLRPAGPLPTGAELVQLIAAHGITVADLPTAYWHEWVRELQLQKQALPATLRLVIVGGEKASADCFAIWRELAGTDVAWLNTYGPTEGTIIATTYDADQRGADGGRSELPIGRPIANVQVHLLDRHMQPVPVGVPGELYIGGAGVARGYLNRPDLTTERFVPLPPTLLPEAATLSVPAQSQGNLTHHPPCTADQESQITHHPPRLYRTGDLARYRPDGNIEFLGRTDDQVKVRGYRIELAEIEAVLRQHPALHEGVVVAREDSRDGRRLVAYVVPAERGAAIDAAGLRAFLQEKLPDFMVPAAFVPLDALPLTPNGKLDRRALPIPDLAHPNTHDAYVAPRTPQEATLASIYAQILGIPRVGIHDDFFALGGDSILAIQLIARANQAGLHLTPKQLFQAPTVATLATLATPSHSPIADQLPVQGPVPLTPIQYWFFAQNLPHPHHWNQSLLLDLPLPLNPTFLRSALAHLLSHHDALRLRFHPTPNGWHQLNAPPDDNVPLDCFDFSSTPDSELSARIQTTTAYLQTTLNISHGPLIRLAYFQLDPHHPNLLFITIHHLAVDAVSWPILLHDFLTAYLQLSHNQTVHLPPKTTSFQSWAQRLSQFAHSDTLLHQLDYWLSLADYHPSPLPLDNPLNTNPNTLNTEASARSVTVALDPDDTRTLLHDLPLTYHTNIYHALLTALAHTLAPFTQSHSILLDLESHGREDLFDDVDLSRTVGWFTSTYPLLLHLPSPHDPPLTLRTVKEQLHRVPQHGLGFGLLRYLHNDPTVRNRLAALPQPQVSFNYLGQLDHTLPNALPLQPATMDRGPERSPSAPRSHLFDITAAVANDQLHIEWSYSENLHHRTTAEKLAQESLEALRVLIHHCQSRPTNTLTPADLAEFGWSQEDVQSILSEIQGSSQDVPTDMSEDLATSASELQRDLDEMAQDMKRIHEEHR